MPYAFIQDVPVDEDVYRQVRAKLGDEPPKGLVAHLVIKRDTGLRYIDIWDTEADWQLFRGKYVEPAVGEVLASLGIPHHHALVNFEDIEVIDTWLGDTAAP